MQFPLRPYQQEAVQAVLGELAVADRANVVMACGTGKTLIEINVAKQFGRILFLEPSLALIKQTLQRARSEGLDSGRQLLCICSDETVAKDEWRLEQGELGVPVTTDSAEVAQALSACEGGVLVFCTYQSVPLLSEGLPANFAFEIGVFDESHKTAGAIQKAFSAGLRDDCLPIRKRFFATATPRVFFGDQEPTPSAMNSMDNVATYGKTAFRMSVREAVSQGIICDYQVLVSATTEAVAKEACGRAREMILPQGQLPVELVAAQLSVLRAAQTSGARRIITYHSTIAEAQEFASDSLGILSDAGFATFHIYGAMPSRQRDSVIEAFLNCDGRALITNARCLSEGVDVPAIDLVALMSKRESVVDVVQIVGRALRPYPGKTTGYVMLPLFVDSTSAPEQALSSSDLAVTWEILHSILETGEDATEFHRVGEPSGRNAIRARSGSSTGHLRVVADEELLPVLERGIIVRPVRRLAHDSSQMLDAARAYRAREGHLRVPINHAEGVLRLGAWLTRMRRMRTRGYLAPAIENELTRLGCEFGASAARKAGKPIVEILAEEGSLSAAWRRISPADRRLLRKWKKMKESGQLSLEQAQAIEGDGINLDEVPAARFEPLPRLHAEESFARSMGALREFAAEKPEATPEVGARFQGVDLAEFLRRQRKLLRRGQLSESRATELDQVGIKWRSVARDGAFERDLEALREFRITHGHQRLPSSSTFTKLRRFVQQQRKLQGRLSAVRRKQLEDVGFTWTSEEDTWEFHVAAMRSTVAAGKNPLRVPAHAAFVSTMLKRHRSESLDPRRLDVLAKFGVAWAGFSGEDTSLLARIAALSKKYGKVNLETILRQHPELQAWVSSCKQKYADDSLDDGISGSLTKLGIRMPARRNENQAAG